MKKTLLIILLSFGLSSCVTTEDIKSVTKRVSNNVSVKETKEEVKDDGIEFIQWECYQYNLMYKYEKHLLNIGYFPYVDESFPVSDFNLGMLHLLDTDTFVPVYYSLMGVKHTFRWGNLDISNDTSFTIKIDSDGSGHFWDFTGVKNNESVKSSQTYDCKPPETVMYDKDDFNEFVKTHFK